MENIACKLVCMQLCSFCVSAVCFVDSDRVSQSRVCKQAASILSCDADADPPPRTAVLDAPKLLLAYIHRLNSTLTEMFMQYSATRDEQVAHHSPKV